MTPMPLDEFDVRLGAGRALPPAQQTTRTPAKSRGGEGISSVCRVCAALGLRARWRLKRFRFDTAE